MSEAMFLLTLALAAQHLARWLADGETRRLITVGFALGRHFPWPRVATYAVAQVAGATCGALLLRVTLGDAVSLGVTRPAGTDLQAVVWEALLTFVLMLVITAVATDTRAVGEAAALAIGGAVTLGALVGGPVTGASMNPARSLAPALVSGDLGSLWVYLAGPIISRQSRRPSSRQRAIALCRSIAVKAQ